MRPAPSLLSLYFAAAYTLLAIYASLHPFSGWRDSGVDPTAFLTAGWPRHWTSFDLLVNVAAYVPLGFLWVPVCQPRLGRRGAVLLATLCGAALSLAMETLQNYLPSRVPSNVDLGCNALGTLIGALAGARWGHQLLDGGRLHALRMRLFLAGGIGDAGLLLLGLWLLTQLTPETLLFGNGDLRGLLDLPAPLAFSAGRFAQVEAAIVCGQTLAVALLATRLERVSLRAPVLALLAGALAVKSFVLALSLGAAHGFAWTTYGAVAGLAAGIGLWLAATLLPAGLQKVVAALALLFATVLVNLAPDNPYLANTWQTWNPGQFLNFHGLTKLTSSLWPFLALPWLMILRNERK
ncbi:MAG: VanZ family protein [Rhodocyclaceae bacterium]|nr:VanZ family protein [Rhodocyclaceae bacterium]